jgi:transposase
VGKKLVVGVDVAKGSFAVSLFDGERFRDFSLSSSPEELLERVAPHLPEDPGEVFFIMEATGVYHFNLALFLRKKGYPVSVVNPFVAKKFAEMLQKRAKTDSVDARTLAQFGFFASPPPFVPKDEKAYLLEEIQKSIEDYQKRRTEILNHLEAIRHRPFYHPKLQKLYEEELQRIEKTLKDLEKEAENLAMEYAPREYELLQTIPGVGKRLAGAILGILSPLTRFESSKELSSFLGLAPQIDQSGKRKERARLSKRGNPLLRKLLYLASLSASRFNRQCKLLYERLVTQGKPKKVALIAVANKLLKQIFAILRSGIPYDPYYLEKKRNVVTQGA